MTSSAEIAQDLGYIDIPDGVLIHPGEIRNFPRGTSLRADQRHPGRAHVGPVARRRGQPQARQIDPGDTVVLSSRIIPGNEKAIYRMIDHLFRRDAHVIYDDGSKPPVHVSGHASQEELKLLINLVRPRYFIPIHGEYRQLKLHAELAASMKGAVGQRDDDRKRRRAGIRRTGRAQEGRGFRWGASALIPARWAKWWRTSSSATAATSAKTASCCPSSPSTSSPAGVESRPGNRDARLCRRAPDNGFLDEARESVMRTLEDPATKRRPTTASSRRRSART